MTRLFRAFLLLLLSIVLFSSCASTTTTTAVGVATNEAPRFHEIGR